ncbi:MAG: LysM peptidoglycan-binding domain-containing protein, partial [Flavobacteriales bacterium]|nr:LysM peptidoglycan-binding domain-containing protein [Flavobacteriales bacterium]
MQKLLLIIALCVSMLAQAQHDFIIEEIDGKKFYVHTVEKGHTLYSISHLYQVEIEDITANNAGSESGLSIGQVLRIPVEGEVDPNAWENPIRLEGEFLIHRVKRGETLFAI